jgi:SAM-dependent methyltransferase
MLVQMASARRFNSWMAETIAPYVDGCVLEIGAGIGNLTQFLFHPGDCYLAAELDEVHLRYLRARLGQAPGLSIAKCDLLEPVDLRPYRDSMDTVVCLNVLEHISDDLYALRNIRACLKCGGHAIILVPQGPQVYGSLDRVLGHERRYLKSELQSKITAAGLHLERIIEFNRATYPGWILNSRILERTTLSGVQLRMFDLLVPLWRRIDQFLPWPATSLIAVASRHDC